MSLQTKRRKKMLVLDGGGAKGGFTIQIASLLAAECKRQKKSLVKTFDLIVGTSVGGWIAAWIGLGWMDEGRNLNDFTDNMIDVYRNQNDWGLLADVKYDGVGKRSLLIDVFGNKKMGEMKTNVAIVTCSLGGKIRMFTNQEDRDVLVVDVLDATSAVPVFFPPVLIQGIYYQDGGILANTPLNRAWLHARKLWPKEEYKMLSIGTQNICEATPPKEFVDHMGLFAHISMGLLDVMTGAGDDTPMEMMMQILGTQHFYRIWCNCGSMRLDDVRMETQSKMQESIKQVWAKESKHLFLFLQED